MTDVGLVERLRECASALDHADAMSIKPTSPREVETTQVTTVESRIIQKALREAAARIEVLEKALRPFADHFSFYGEGARDDDTFCAHQASHTGESHTLTIGDLRRARQALASSLLCQSDKL
jgi:hypothetical protein